MADSLTGSTRALKLVVIVMGVMLIVGLAVVVGTIAMRVSHRAVPAAAPATAPVAVMAPSGETRMVELPAGSGVLAVQSDGDRVMVRVALASGGEALILLDWKTGARLATIELKAAAPEAAKP